MSPATKVPADSIHHQEFVLPIQEVRAMTIVSRTLTALSLCGVLSATSIAQIPPAPPVQNVPLFPGEQIVVGATPVFVTTGQLNGDSTLDLVVANPSHNLLPRKELF
jgi:hypothetical protein